MNEIFHIRITVFSALLLSQTVNLADSAVLDPALYLYPTPPLLTSSDATEGKELWTRSSRSNKLHFDRSSTDSKETTMATSSTMEQESMEGAETFWPKLRSIDYTLKQIHVPVTFALSGNYGGYRGAGVIGKTYASVGGASLFSYGKSALAGTGYGSYGSPVRVYGGQDGPAWSGWGNGKWGHYGKG